MDQQLEQRAKQQFLTGAGEVGALMRAMDWSQTPLGPVQDWPQSLRTAVSICLHSRFELFIWWGPQLTMVYNDAYRQTLASKHPWAMGKPGSVVWSEIWPIIGPMLHRVLETGEATWSDDLRLILERHGYPEETFHTFSYSPILDESGGIGGVFTAVSQTTERVIGERRLRTLRDLAARAVDTQNESDAWKTAAEAIGENDSDVPFAVLYRLEEDGCHLTAAAHTGISNEDRFCPPEMDLSNAEHPLTALVKQAVADSKPLEVSDADRLGFDLPGGAAKVTPCELVLAPLTQTGQTQPLGVLVAGVSQLKRLDDSYRTFFNLMAGQIAKSVSDAQAFENERKRAEALAELDRAKTAFFSNVSHEFRTPLTLMLGPLEDTMREGKQRLSAEDLQQLNVIHRNGLRLLKLVNNLLDFSRIEAGRVQASYQPTDLASTTSELASVFRSNIEKAGMKLIVKCDPLREPVYVDRDMWEKIVLNLLSNAFKFTFEGSITVELHDKGKQVELRVTDTGTGIPADEIPRLFERFHRVEGARGRTFGGTGIGLALVQELVKLHGGSVSVQSEFGKGTTFTVTVPKGKAHLPPDQIESSRALVSTAMRRADSYVEEAMRWLPEEFGVPHTEAIPSVAGGEKRSGVEPHLPGGRILLADDNADMRDYVRRLLEHNYDVTAVSNGREALDVMLNDPHDLVLSDVMMPVLDGFTLLRYVRENPRIASTPVILLSARAGEESRVEGLQSGADDYLVKPFTARELMARVGAHLSMAKARREAALRELELRASAELERQRLRELFVQAPAAIGMTTGPDHRIVFMNPPYLRLLGRERYKDILGKPFREVVPEVIEQGIFDLLDDVYRTGRTYVEHERQVRLDRTGTGQPETGYFNFVLQPARNVHGELEGILIHVTEVTDQVVARQEIERRERLLQIAQRAAKAGSFEYNLETGDLFWTEDYYLLHDAPLSIKPSYEQWAKHVHPDDLAQAESRVQHSIAERRELLENEYRVITLDGSIRWLATHGRLFYDKNGKPLRLVGISMDITQRKKSEDALRRTEKLAATGRLAASIAHEINNPLEAVTNLLFLVSSYEMNDEAREYLRAAERELARVSDIATQTLRFYRQSYAAVNTRVSELMDSVLNVYQGRLNAANVKIVKDYAEVKELKCMAGEIRQVLANLVGNALDAMDKGGKLLLRIRESRDWRDGFAPGIRFTVADNGSGIPKEILPKIFEPFVTTKESTGTGLGLWVSSEIVGKHAGYMQVRSRIGKDKSGTVFTVFLPYAASTPPKAAHEGVA
jgi:signal transduction histidine kinase/DNA-binding NarL/FixJ family response regulator